MAENLKLQYCETRPGILKALFDPNYGNQSEPFTQLTIPGNIPAVHYDHGSIAIGYSDTEFKNVNGPGGGTWNNGWRYRNDGVDIENSTDPQGYDYNVGWIEDNEWLKYTVQVNTTGIYRADFRVASTGSVGQLRVYINNQPISGILPIPNTGGWQNWVTVGFGNLQLNAGTQEMIISFPQGGFNLNQVSFSFISSDIQDDKGSLQDKYELNQNYPNPFNPSTEIQFVLPQSSLVELSVINMQGELIKKLINRYVEAGSHSVNFKADDLSSGIYFYRLKAENFTETRKMVLMR
jgi:hypothetical protein